MKLRSALPADQPFLEEMLWLAHTWRETPHPPVPGRLPEAVNRYVDGFGRPGDHGVIAVCAGENAGAAWWRHRTAADAGYGYLRDDVPELSVAVRPAWRRQGVATAMLTRLANDAAVQGLPALSLSVEPDNPAALVYRRAGFVVAAQEEGSLTMVLESAP